MIARLAGTRELSPDVRHFDFEVPEQEYLTFSPGQFLSFTAELDGKMITRAYSIASAPHGNQFSLCLNKVEDGRFSPYLFRMNVGDEVEMKGPYGTFVFRNPRADTVMVATGTGVAPFRSMLFSELPHDSTHQFTLIFGVRHEHGLLYRDEFQQMEKDSPNFRFVPTLTRPGENWSGQTGRVQQRVLETIGERRDVDVYICGMAGMVNEVRALLKERGFERKQIIVEKYD